MIVDFRFLFAITSCSNSHDNMWTSVCYSSIETFLGSQFVQEKLSIAAEIHVFGVDIIW